MFDNEEKVWHDQEGAEDISLVGGAVRGSEQPPQAERQRREAGGVGTGMKHEACQKPPWPSSARVLQV